VCRHGACLIVQQQSHPGVARSVGAGGHGHAAGIRLAVAVDCLRHRTVGVQCGNFGREGRGSSKGPCACVAKATPGSASKVAAAAGATQRRHVIKLNLTRLVCSKYCGEIEKQNRSLPDVSFSPPAAAELAHGAENIKQF
jgi:hypothetical protein